MFMSEVVNQILRFIQRTVLHDSDYLYWIYGWITAWDSHSAMLSFEE